MARCANCGAAMSCGCQKRAASNGQSACSGCINTLEATLTAAKQTAATLASTAQNITTPQRWGRDRYNKK